MLLLGLLTGCTPVVADDGAPPAIAIDALSRNGCDQCHAVPGLPARSTQQTCAGCHGSIAAILRDPARRALAEQDEPGWTARAQRVQSFLDVPSLDAAFVRLDSRWVDGWLQDPHDVRPRLREGMPRVRLTDDDRAAITGAFTARQTPVPKTPRPSRRNATDGRARFLTYGCTSCHDVGADLPASPGVARAPDLAHVRERMHPDRIVAWIQDPSAWSTEATMPSFDVTRDDAILIRDYLLFVDPGTHAPPDDLPPVRPVQRPVRWAEVAPILQRSCADCHLDPARPVNRGRVVPGRQGGFGWTGIDLHVQSPDGLRPWAGRVVPALLRRREEARRDRVLPGQHPATIARADRPGMPLATPPLTDPEIARIAAWIEQGLPN